MQSLTHHTTLHQVGIGGEIEGVHLLMLGYKDCIELHRFTPSTHIGYKDVGCQWATKRFLCLANAAVGHRWRATNGEGRLLVLSPFGLRQLVGMCRSSILLAGQITAGCWPRSSTSRHSFSIGV